MIHYQLSSLIDAPVEVVWAFHERSDVLDKLAPPWQPMTIVRREGGLDVGAITEFQIWLGAIPIRWLAQHTVCEKYRLFVDEQAEGPFQFWRHQHQFAAEQGKTRLTDTITCTLPGGEWTDWVAGWAIEAQLDSLFRYRHRITQQDCTA